MKCHLIISYTRYIYPYEKKKKTSFINDLTYAMERKERNK